MIQEPMKQVTLRLPLALYEQLQQQAQDTTRTLPGYIRYILKFYLRHPEYHENQR